MQIESSHLLVQGFYSLNGLLGGCYYDDMQKGAQQNKQVIILSGYYQKP
jgi:hypothetical protein